MFTCLQSFSISFFAKRSLSLFLALIAIGNLANAHTCKHVLGELAYSNYASTPTRVATENSRKFREANTTSTLSKLERLRAFHIHNPRNRFPADAPVHAVIFDRFGFLPDDFTAARNKVNSLSTQHASPDKFPMGAEAFSPNTALLNLEEAANWMRSVLLEVQSQNKDGRPLVIYARGALCEAAAYLAKREPQLFSSLILENPISGADHSQLPHWKADSFSVPTYIVTGTHNASYLHSLKQQLYDLSKNAEISDGQRHVHYMDIPFAEKDVFGNNQKEAAKELADIEIYRFINKHILKASKESISPERFLEMVLREGIGTRRIFGDKLHLSPEDEINAIRAGLLLWEIPIKPISSVEEALAHIQKLNEVREKPRNGLINRPLFFISDHANLDKISSSKSLEDALSNLNGDPLNMIREAAQSGKRFFWIDEAGTVHDYAPEKVLNLPLEAVHYNDNKNGFVFNASGWMLPVIRGVIDISEAKKSSAYRTGRTLYYGGTDRKGKPLSPGIILEGYYFKKNFNFAGVLEKLRNMNRKGQSENATRFLDPANIMLMQRLYEAGLLETTELYNSKGELIAGGMTVKIDNVLSPETLFYPPPPKESIPNDAPLSQKLEGIDFAKIIVTRMIDDAANAGHTKLDSQIVSSFTILFNPKYVNTDTEFLPFIRELNANWKNYQQKLLEEKQKVHDQHASRLEAKRPEIDALQKKISETASAYDLARENYEKLKIDRNMTEAEKLDPAILEQIEAGRTAKKEARRLETELAQAKAQLEAMLSDFIPNDSVLSKAEIKTLLELSKEKLNNNESFLKESLALEQKTRDEYNSEIARNGDSTQKAAELKTRLDRSVSKIAGLRQAYEEARVRVANLEDLLRSRDN